MRFRALTASFIFVFPLACGGAGKNGGAGTAVAQGGTGSMSPAPGATGGNGMTAGQPPPTTASGLPPSTGVGTSDVVKGDLWSNPATWGGKVPDATSDVTIPAGKSVVLDQSTCVHSLTIEGQLGFADADIELCSGWIMAHSKGRLSIGSEKQPFTHHATITLKDGGDPNQDVMGMGTKFLGAMDGGILDIHGSADYTAWSKLSGPVAAGATSIDVVDTKGWQVGDSIVIATGSFDPDEAEVHSVTAVSGNTLTLGEPLKTARTGNLSMIAGRAVDTRSEVGRLTRNIVIQGDPASDATQFGGHVMIMAGGEAYVDGIELRRMGQYDHLGRYPFHWHIVGEASGQYLKNSVVNVSFQRGIVVHSTLHALIENNIVFDSHGHNYMVETPITNDNIFHHNLAVKNRIAVFSQETLKTQNDNEAANFWIRSAKNTFTENSAAGSTATGFWYDSTTDGPTVFDQNFAHAAASRGTGADFVRESGLLVQPAPTDAAPVVLELGNSTLFQSKINLWPTELEQHYKDFTLVGAAGPQVTAEAVGAHVKMSNTLFVASAPGSGVTNMGPALLVQYGARVDLDQPTFVGFANGVLSDNDIAQPFMSDFTISAPKFVDSTPGTIPEGSIAELKDNAIFPAGFYVPASAPQLAGPDMQLVTVGTGENAAQFYFGAQRECPTAQPQCEWGKP